MQRSMILKRDLYWSKKIWGVEKRWSSNNCKTLCSLETREYLLILKKYRHLLEDDSIDANIDELETVRVM